MKRSLSIFLAVVLMFALALPVLAAEETSETFTTSDSETSQVVTATYEAGENVDGGKVYHVTVAWSVNSTLKYTDGDTTYTWNAEATKYEGPSKAAGTWDGNATVTITVTNKSNDGITATAEWEAATPIEADCTFTTDGKVDVDSAAKDTDLNASEPVLEGKPETGTITATVATPTEGSISADNQTVGTITVNIAATED